MSITKIIIVGLTNLFIYIKMYISQNHVQSISYILVKNRKTCKLKIRDLAISPKHSNHNINQNSENFLDTLPKLVQIMGSY